MMLDRIYFKQWVVCAVFGLIAGTTYANDAEPPKAGAGVTVNEQGKATRKWETDDSLRQGMDSIRKTMAACQQDIKSATLGEQAYRKLAQEVNRNLDGVISSRKLGKDAETAFHLVVMVDLNHSVELMLKSRDVKLQRVGALGVLQILRNYGTYFQHPEWSVAHVGIFNGKAIMS